MTRAVHVLPHIPGGCEGHNSRHAALAEQIPSLELRWHGPNGGQELDEVWDLALVESDASIPKANCVVHIARALSRPIRCDLTIPIGPYEGLPGSVGPLVRIAPEHKRDIDLLLVPSRGQNNHWFNGLPGTPGGWGMMSRSRLVICGGGGGSLYEALWSGCRVVCLPQSAEQKVRARNAVAAGEAIAIVGEFDPQVVADLIRPRAQQGSDPQRPQTMGALSIREAQAQVEKMIPLGRRPSGVAEAVARIMGAVKAS